MSEETHDFEHDFRTAAERNARKAAELEEKLLKKIEDRLDKMDDREAASALRAVADMKAKNIEKLRGGDKPPETEDDALETLAGMAKKGYIKFVGGNEHLTGDDEEKT